MEQLRHPDTGCPWDLEQTLTSLIPYTIEETYEVAQALTDGHYPEIKDELGDLLFQVVFYTRLTEESGHFDFDEVAMQTATKLIRRHPHVFHADGTPLSAHESRPSQAEIKARWEAIKQEERAEKQQLQPTESTVFADIPEQLPSLLRALKLQKRAASVGFDWDSTEPVVAKIREELNEVEVELAKRDQEALEGEIGDLLFAVINLARHVQVHPEQALRRTNQKFQQRFQAIERELSAAGQAPSDLNLTELERYWQKVKQDE
ncbi:nucleoside triphosphate pyrophosphohydrolase [Pseudidiomarina aestuarii]|uniref:Nucleoside triphosphate pyrophosphohydrolase n=2 Tax=Pseudidiomarina aestuarii TaxID=624146 RepID=A0A7Z6ZW47_9GAMM|nr:nucleoside triphosphate pyrophosphohydrolase [Pseudidiomarina aestuarii]